MPTTVVLLEIISMFATKIQLTQSRGRFRELVCVDRDGTDQEGRSATLIPCFSNNPIQDTYWFPTSMVSPSGQCRSGQPRRGNREAEFNNIPPVIMPLISTIFGVAPVTAVRSAARDVTLQAFFLSRNQNVKGSSQTSWWAHQHLLSYPHSRLHNPPTD
jgi:hypothetical protein